MSAAEKQPEQQSPDASPATNDKVAFSITNLENRLSSLIDVSENKNRVSFGYVVLTCVSQGQYDRALLELDSVGQGFEEYPAFEIRARRFIDHAKGLVSAIRTKHQVGKSPHVNKSKQKELSDKITEHFVDLKRTLIVIEKVQKSVRAKDLGSTILFFKTCFFATVVLFLCYTVYQNSAYSNTFSFRDLLDLFTFQWPD